jgi:nucleotide-binding universal stress UspA family protein
MSTPRTRPILVCYDRSAGSRRAVELAGALFPGRRVVVLHVWTPLSVTYGPYGVMMPPSAEDDYPVGEAAAELAAEGAQLANASGLDARPDAVSAESGGTSHTILDVADQHDAELIVLGARGLSPFRSLFLGSVSHAVVQHARRPVLVVPPPTSSEEVLLPTDDDSDSSA